MANLPLWALVSICVASAAALFGFWTALANEVFHETSVHTLKGQVIDLRTKYLKRMIEVYNLEDPEQINDGAVTETETHNDTSHLEQPNQSTPDPQPQEAAAA